MTAITEAEFERQLRTFVGRDCGSHAGHDAVNRAMIRHWCEVMGNTNPVYLDEAWASRSTRGHRIAPPTMMFAWTQEGYSVTTVGRPPNAQVDLVKLFDDNGYRGTVATNVTQEYFREVELGDVISERTVIDNISERKQTALGSGYFYETVSEFSNQRGERIGRQVFRVLKFMPPKKGGAAS